jgi:RNA polymerase sigma factor (sigma-70 family)
VDPHESDETLLAAWRQGDSAAGDRLIRRHFSAVFRFFRTKVTHAVDDLVQRTFLACVEAREGYRGEARFRTYLLGIARIQLLRFLQRELPRIPDPLEQTSLSLAQSSGGSPSGIAAIREQQDVLVAALQRIPLNLQMTVELHYWEELGVQEIATVMGVPSGTVKTRLRRARLALRDAIDGIEAPVALRAETLAGLADWVRALQETVGDEQADESDDEKA